MHPALGFGTRRESRAPAALLLERSGVLAGERRAFNVKEEMALVEASSKRRDGKVVEVAGRRWSWYRDGACAGRSDRERLERVCGGLNGRSRRRGRRSERRRTGRRRRRCEATQGGGRVDDGRAAVLFDQALQVVSGAHLEIQGAVDLSPL